MLDTVTENPDLMFSATASIRELQSAYFKIQVRKRVTADGGKSIMAIEGSPSQAPTRKPASSTFNLSDLAASPAANGLPAPAPIAKSPLFGERASSFWAPPLPTIVQTTLPKFEQPQIKAKNSKPLSGMTNPATEKTGLFSLPGVGIVTPFVSPPAPSTSKTPFPEVEQPKDKLEDVNPKTDEWILNAMKQKDISAPVLNVIASIRNIRAQPETLINQADDSSSDDESGSESESSGASESDEKVLEGAEIGKEAVGTMSRQFASLGTQNQKPFVFKSDSVSKGAPVFPVLGPLKKGKQPQIMRFKAREKPDPSAPHCKFKYLSITTPGSWYDRLSFEVRKNHRT